MRRARDNPFAVHRVLRERYRLSALGVAGAHGAARAARLARRDRGTARERQDHAARRSRRPAGSTGLARSTGCGSTPTSDDSASRRMGRGRLRAVRRRRAVERSRLAALARRAGRAGGLVITTHRAGRLPAVAPLRNVPRAVARPGRVARRAAVRRECGELHARHDGNLRAALRELYDRWSMGAT